MSAQYEVKTGSENQEEIATAWDSISEEAVFDPDAAKKLAQEVKNEQSVGEEDARDGALEIADLQPAQAEEIVPTPEVEKEETKKFSGLELTDDELGADLVRINGGIKYRRERDEFGRAHDRRKLHKIFDKMSANPKDGERYYKKIKPTMIGEVVSLFEEGKFNDEYGKKNVFADGAFGRIFEAMPLEAQEKIAATREGQTILWREQLTTRSIDDDGLEKRMLAKMLAGMAERMETGALSDEEVDDFEKKVLSGVTGLGNGGLLGKVRCSLSESLIDKATKTKSVDEVYLAMSMPPSEDRDRCVKKVLENKTDLNALECAYLLRGGYGKDDLPNADGLSYVANAMKGDLSLLRENKRSLEKIDEEEAEGLKAYASFLLEKRLLDDDEKYKLPEMIIECAGIARGKEGTSLFLDVTKKYDDLDEAQKDVITDFYVHLNECSLYGLDLSEMSAETIPNLKGLCKEKLFAEAADGSLDYKAARTAICERLLGARMGEVMREMVAFGIVDYSSQVDNKELFSRTGSKSIEDYYEKDEIDWGSASISKDALAGLRESGQITEEEEAVVLAAGAMLCCRKEGLQSLAPFLDKGLCDGKEKIMDVVAKIRDRLSREAARKYTEYMQRGLEGVVATGETVLSGDKEVSVLKMEGDEFMLLIHKLAAFNEMQDVMRPEAWDHYAGEERNKTTRISTSAISNESLVLADSKAIYGSRKILYGYSEIPPDGFRFSSGNDLWTLQTGMPHRQDYFYKSPKDVVKNMLDVSGNQQDLSPPHNEVVIDGESESGGRLPPNYIVVFGKNKSDIHFGPAKHAAYFQVPILLIDPDKYGKREK